MKSLLVTGNCPYNQYQERCLQESGVDAHIFGEWGMHLPDHVDALLEHKADILHLQWPEAMTRHQDKEPSEVIAEVRGCLSKLKESGAKLFWVMHNLLPHRREKSDMWKEIWQVYADVCDVACHHSQCGMEKAITAYDYGDSRHEILYHGYFESKNPCLLSETEVRKQLGLPLNARIFLSVGSLRPDKHIRELIETFGQRDSANEILMLAGNASWNDYGREMIQLAEKFSNVTIDPEFISDEKLALYAKACTSFLYMYGENHLTSGSPHLSQAFLLPQTCLDFPYAREVLGEGANYVELRGNRSECLHSILNELNEERLETQRRFIEENRHPWCWSRIARKTKEAYEQALES